MTFEERFRNEPAFKFRVIWAILMVFVALMLIDHPSIAVAWAVGVTAFIELATRRLYSQPKRKIELDFTALRHLHEHDNKTD